jgi:hypothetical protein
VQKWNDMYTNGTWPEQPRSFWRELLDQLLKRLQRDAVAVHDRGSEERVAGWWW